MAGPGAVDPRARAVGAVPAAQRVAGRGRDLAGGPAVRPRDMAHAGAHRCRARAVLPADARPVRLLRRRHHDAAAAVGPGHGGGGGLCRGHGRAAGRALAGHRGRDGVRTAARRAVPPPGGPPLRAGGRGGRDLHPAAGRRAPGRRTALEGVRGRGAGDRAAELAVAADPARASADGAVGGGRARDGDPVGGGLGGGGGRCAAPDPGQPHPVRPGGLDTADDLAHGDRPRRPRGDRRARGPGGAAGGGPPPGGGRGAAAAGGAPVRARRPLPGPAAAAGPLCAVQHAGAGPADRRGA
ncbi:hypothetical protein SGPA1_30063 [Streptomyces misionensis JCM 4497]